MNGCYIFNAQREPEPCHDLMTWAKAMDADRTVARTTANGVTVSTIFLGLDHSFGGPVPILYETMIFGGPHDGYQERHTTREKAHAGHLRACAEAWPA